MARSRSILLHNMRGAIGKQMVVKQYGSKTVVTRYPDMSKIKPTKLQKQKRSKFADAVAYAQGILGDPARKAAYARKLKKGATVYNTAIREYLKSKI